MEFRQYAELASRTAEDPHGIKWPGTGALNHLHALIGLATELAELSAAIRSPEHSWHVVEELGDCWWYLALGISCQKCHESLSAQPPAPSLHDRPSTLIRELLDLVGESLDVLKRRIFYGADGSDRKASFSRIKYRQMADIMFRLGNVFGVPPKTAWEANLKKLEKRYPGKFNREDALHRDLEEERSVGASE